MCRSSRILCFLLTIVAGPALAQGAALRMAGPAPALSGAPNPGVRPGIAPGIQPNRGVMPNVLPNVRPGIGRGVAPGNGVQPGVRSGLAPRGFGLGRFGFGARYAGGLRGRPFGRVRGRGYGGVDAVGLGLSLAGDLAAPPYGDVGYGDPGFDPDFVPAYAPPPRCIRPQIIKIGRGLRRPAHTRIVYGRPPDCVP